MGLFGVDVSHHNGHLDFTAGQLKEAAFVSVKATEGTGFVDPRFLPNYRAAKAAGKLTGAYHFFRAQLPVDLQLHRFFSVYEPQAGDLLPMFDGEVMDDVRVGQWKDRALAFCKGIKDRTGKWPFAYLGGVYFRQELGDLSAFKDCPLWAADYAVNKYPRFNLPWTDWTMWQYTDKDGMDLDLFNGTAEQLKAFTI